MIDIAYKISACRLRLSINPIVPMACHFDCCKRGGKRTDAIGAVQDGRQPLPHVALTIPTIHTAQSA